jgi:hypothetical protein
MARWLRVGGAAIAVTLTYSSVLVHRYGMSDDYWFLDAVGRGVNLVESFAAVGRPLCGVALQLALPLANGVAGLVWLRFVAVLGLIGFDRLLAAAGRHSGLGEIESECLGLIGTAIPALQVAAGWATGFSFPLAAIVAAASWRSLSRETHPASLARAWVCLLAAFCIHQSLAMTFCGFWAIDLLMNEATESRNRRDVRALVTLISAAAANVALGRVCSRWLSFRGQEQRALLVFAPVRKAEWFVREVLPAAWNLASVRPSLLAAFVAALTMFALVAFVFRGERRVDFWRWCALVPLSYAPSLLAREDYASYRTQAGLALVLSVSFFVTLVALLRPLRAPMRDAVLLAFAVASLGIAGHQVWAGIARPQSREFSLLVERLTDARAARASAVCMIAARERDALWTVRYDEFGRPSTAAEWSRGEAIRLAWRERFKSTPPPLIVGDCERAPPATFEIDMRRLR